MNHLICLIIIKILCTYMSFVCMYLCHGILLGHPAVKVLPGLAFALDIIMTLTRIYRRIGTNYYSIIFQRIIAQNRKKVTNHYVLVLRPNNLLELMKSHNQKRFKNNMYLTKEFCLVQQSIIRERVLYRFLYLRLGHMVLFLRGYLNMCLNYLSLHTTFFRFFKGVLGVATSCESVGFNQKCNKFEFKIKVFFNQKDCVSTCGRSSQEF